MSYSKLEVRYYGDGLNTTESWKETRQGVIKKKTIILSKKVQEYGDKYGYNSIKVDFDRDHIKLYSSGWDLLFDQDINGNSNEYIKSIVDYDWLY